MRKRVTSSLGRVHLARPREATAGASLPAASLAAHILLGRSSCRSVATATGSAEAAGSGNHGKMNLSGAPFPRDPARKDYMQRYRQDLARLSARLLEEAGAAAGARWVDSHCHLESILCRTWGGGGTAAVRESEQLLTLQDLVSLWPAGMEFCICNAVFRKPYKLPLRQGRAEAARSGGAASCLSEWGWLRANLNHFHEGSRLASRLKFTVGIHPHEAVHPQGWDEEAALFVRELAAHPLCVGIGECGMDLLRHKPRLADRQLDAFRAQLRLAVELGKPVVVHSRSAARPDGAAPAYATASGADPVEAACMSALTEELPRSHAVHMHCYSGSLEHAQRLCDHFPRLRLGFTGALTFGGKRGAQLAALVTSLPLERLLLETDGPYMCPAPFRGQTAHPGHVHLVAEQIADIKGETLSKVLAATRESTRAVYGI
ncbi:unnamed protein product [Polarella glacialis]|uniref:Uncharacterized protein n=1 Tax=Polarella glacialis TaxID=89957 RepID=A0A813HET3_POLGL|nr:unnamed protein product [Polarella glacialis]CAE8636468.1 unnamed protein product [Polarella glacialis]